MRRRVFILRRMESERYGRRRRPGRRGQVPGRLSRDLLVGADYYAALEYFVGYLHDGNRVSADAPPDSAGYRIVYGDSFRCLWLRRHDGIDSLPAQYFPHALRVFRIGGGHRAGYHDFPDDYDHGGRRMAAVPKAGAKRRTVSALRGGKPSLTSCFLRLRAAFLPVSSSAWPAPSAKPWR